ncbi:MAG: GPW/gp25 family protein [Candidatus Binataceae bacterium]
MARHDYAFPFRIDPASGQAARTGYETHVEQMIRQLLLTSPGERIDLPDFGCGLRKLLFAPNSDALAATTQILVLQSLSKWLGNQIQVQNVSVKQPDPTQPFDPAQLLIEIDYVLIETQAQRSLAVKVI